MKFKGASSIGGVFVVLALTISILTLTHLTLEVGKSLSEFVERIRFEEELLKENLEIISLEDHLEARIVGGSKSAYLVTLSSNGEVSVVEVEDADSWFNVQTKPDAEIYIVSEKGRIFKVGNPNVHSDNKYAVEFGEGALGVEGRTYATLGYLDLNIWTLNSRFEVLRGGFERTLYSKLEISEKKHLIYPDAILEIRDYIQIYVPIFSYISKFNTSIRISYQYSLGIEANFKPEYVRVYKPRYYWTVHLDVGGLPKRRIVYHNGYYWSSYTSNEEPINVEDAISGLKLASIKQTYNVISRSDYVEYRVDKRYEYSMSDGGEMFLNISLKAENPTYVTLLKIIVPVRIIVYQDLINTLSQIGGYYQFKVENIDYTSTSEKT